jgi:hypothetical protein
MLAPMPGPSLDLGNPIIKQDTNRWIVPSSATGGVASAQLPTRHIGIAGRPRRLEVPKRTLLVCLIKQIQSVGEQLDGRGASGPLTSDRELSQFLKSETTGEGRPSPLVVFFHREK